MSSTARASVEVLPADARTLDRLRRFLLALAAFLCAGTAVELALAGHYKEPLQWIPFVLCGFGLAAIGAWSLRPSYTTLWFLRTVMVVMALGSLVGMYEHLSGNFELEREIRPAASAMATLWAALQGAAPMLAPGILAVAALIALAATYREG